MDDSLARRNEGFWRNLKEKQILHCQLDNDRKQGNGTHQRWNSAVHKSGDMNPIIYCRFCLLGDGFESKIVDICDEQVSSFAAASFPQIALLNSSICSQ